MSGHFGEIIATLRKNKLRTFLTGFSIAWGILMLIILLGMGNGVRHGMDAELDQVADNYVNVWAGSTSMPYDGLPVGRRIVFDEKSIETLLEKIPEIDQISPNIVKWNTTLAYEGQYVDTRLKGADPNLQKLVKITIKDTLGRFINDIDERQRRKTIVIHPNTQKVLFKDQNPIGKWVAANGIPYQVVGVYGSSDQFSNNNPPEYIPLETARALYNPTGKIYYFDLSTKGLNTPAQQSEFSERLREGLAQILRFDPQDRSAVYIDNAAENRQQRRKIMGKLNIFLGVIGVASMVAGIVGVGNIMYVTVKERTREIGIRKAIGASPASVIRLVIFEAVFITVVSGYVGIVLGSGALKIIGGMIARADNGVSRGIVNPSVDPGIILVATLILIISGVTAGFIPAWKAAKIKPVEAMKRE